MSMTKSTSGICLCGNVATMRKQGSWVCSRCGEIENRLSHDTHVRGRHGNNFISVAPNWEPRDLSVFKRFSRAYNE